MAGLLKFKIGEDESIDIIDLGGYESRHEAIAKIFLQALDLIELKHLKTREFFINSNDISFPVKGYVTFGFTCAEGVTTCPDFSFWNWPEALIGSYEEVVRNIFKNGFQPYLHDKVFWIGNLETQALRKDLLRFGRNFPDIFEILTYDKNNTQTSNDFISLIDHTKYKYLIDCGARGYSGRLKYLLHSNRPLFIVEREKEKQEYFFSDLIPYFHYIPVKNDLSDLLHQYEWAERNYSKALQIAENAREFCLENLNIEAVINFLSRQIVRTLSKK